MTCSGCVARVKSELLKIGDVLSADVQLNAPQATITMQKHIPLSTLQTALAKAGHYTITMDDHHAMPELKDTSKTWFETYKPLIIVFAFILGISLITSVQSNVVDAKLWMNHFMAAFFITFSFFKFLNLRGFADSYASYDLLAKKWHGYGFVYPFIELGLGIAYVLQWQPQYTNLATIVVMGFSSIGVIIAVTNKRKIQCACLGAVFELPMSTVTIIEDLLMVTMAIIALI